MNKVVLVVSGGRIETVFSQDPIEVEVIDFDSDSCDLEEQESLAAQVDECREKMLEVRC